MNNAVNSFQKNSFTLKLDFYLKLLKIHLNSKKNMIELIESIEELTHQKKSNWTIRYVVVSNYKRITMNYHIV